MLPFSLAAQVAKLNSFPSAEATVYLDFDGHQVQSAGWNNGNLINCLPAPFSATQINDVFNRVAEDFRPFNLNVTTDAAKFTAAPLNKRMRVVVTPTSSWYPAGVGGVSYVGSFTWGDNTPAFVFTDRLNNHVKYTSECITHELGHTVGLSHQSKYDNNCALLAQYNDGWGTGETSWAPLMGNSYHRNMTGWNDGPTPFGCANTQDNLTIITSSNGFGYRTDDYNNQMNNSSFTLTGTSFSAEGVISTSADKDAFRYVLTGQSNINFEIKPFGLGGNAGANLDVMVELYNGNTLIRTYNPLNSLSVSADTVLNPGTYYLMVTGAGNANANDYGSLGAYSIIGFRGALAIHDVTLSGTVQKNKHQLNWNIVADEPIKEQVVEVSLDGINFKALSTINALNKSFNYTTTQSGNIYYRLKVTSVIDQTAYSNVVVLKSSVATEKKFIVSTLVQNDITVNATENYNYRLMDANGRFIAQGNGLKGSNRINVANQAGGMYVLQLMNNNEQQIERIIKQ
jgi:hypothetical protein